MSNKSIIGINNTEAQAQAELQSHRQLCLLHRALYTLVTAAVPADSALNGSNDLRQQSPPMQWQDERDIRELLVKLRAEHRALDAEIASLEAQTYIDQLHVTRLKRKKLQLKDRITALENQLLPDIIA